MFRNSWPTQAFTVSLVTLGSLVSLGFATGGRPCSHCDEPEQGITVRLTNSRGVTVAAKTNESGYYELPDIDVSGDPRDRIFFPGGMVYSGIGPYFPQLPSAGYTCATF